MLTTFTAKLRSALPVINDKFDKAQLPMIPRNVVQLAPWGRPPTPLLPCWYRETLCYLRLPRKIRKANPGLKTVGELGAFWEGVQSQVDKTSLHSLVRLVRGHRPPPNYIVIPAGIDPLELSQYPLRPRTANVIQSVLQREDLLNEDKGLSVGELLSFRNFGIVSLLDLMCVTELALADRVLVLNDVGVHGEGTIHKKPVEHGSEWDDMIDLLGVLLSAAKEFHGVISVREALELDLANLASTIGIAQALDSLMIRNLTNGRRIANTIAERLASFLISMTPREQLIVERRLLTNSPDTLQELWRENWSH